MLNGGSVEKRWQPMSADRWNLPASRSTSFIAENTGRSGQPTQKPGGRCGSAPSSCAAFSLSDLIGTTAASRPRNFERPVSTTSPVYSPASGSTSLPRTFTALMSCRRSVARIASSRYAGWPSSTISTSRWPAHVDLLLLLRIGRRRQADAVVVEVRVLDQRALRERRPLVLPGREAALDVAGAYPELQHHRRARRFRELEAALHHLDDLRQVRARI